MTSNRHSSGLRLVALLFFIILPGFVVHQLIAPGPAVLEYHQGSATVSYRSDRRLVPLPGDCVTLSWTVENATVSAFFLEVTPGVLGGPGTRDVFFETAYTPDYVPTEAPGAQLNLPNDHTTTACIQLDSDPKLRVAFDDGSTRTFQLGIDIVFMRMETWLTLIAVLVIGLWLVRFRHMVLWSGLTLAAFYIYVFIASGVDLRVYWLELITLPLLLVWRKQPAVIGLLWLWAIGLGFDNANTIEPYLWLPLYIWVIAVGLWRLRHCNPTGPLWTAHRIAPILGAVFSLLSLGRDAALLHHYDVLVNADSADYTLTAAAMFDGPGDSGLPKRTFPYVLMNAITDSVDSPETLAWLQIGLAAAGGGLLVYAIGRKNPLLGLLVGAWLIFDLSWGTYNRGIATEGVFTTFHVLSLAVLILHHDRRESLPRWELMAAGILYSWTFLLRGPGIVLIVPVAVIYLLWHRRYAVWIVTGFLAFILIVTGFNRWRYGEFGLIGPQHDTLASALFFYHQFAPENGPASARIDAALRDCMPYLDYEDVPRHGSGRYFIFSHYNPCLLQTWSRDELTDLTGRAFREMALARPFDFARSLIQEMGTFLAYPIHEKTDDVTLTELKRVCLTRYYNWCENVDTRSTDATYLRISQTMAYQLYTLTDHISTHTEAVILAAWTMMAGFVLVTTRGRLRFMALLAAGFVLFHLGSTALVHVFLPRYTVVLSPFHILLSALAVHQIVMILWYHRRVSLPIIGVALVYLALNRPDLTAPITARLLPDNLYRKQAIYDVDHALYRDWHGAAILSPHNSIEHDNALLRIGLAQPPRDLDERSQHLVMRWIFNRMPGYIRDTGMDYLLFDEAMWGELSPADRDTITAEYALADERGGWRLYQVIGDGYGVTPLYNSDTMIVFEQPDFSLHVYRLDANGDGWFVVSLDPDNFAPTYQSEDGWTVNVTAAEDRYRIVLINPAGETVDDGYAYRPLPE